MFENHKRLKKERDLKNYGLNRQTVRKVVIEELDPRRWTQFQLVIFPELYKCSMCFSCTYNIRL